MFCPFCGAQNADETKFCGSCGKNLQTYHHIAAPSKPQTSTAIPTPKKKFTVNKAFISKLCLQLVLSALYSGMAVMMMLFVHTLCTVQLNGSKATALSAAEFLTLLREGTQLFHPTVLCVTLSIAATILLYATPFFALLAIIGVFLKNKHTAFHVSFAVIASLSSALLATVAPLCLRLVPQFDRAMATIFFVLPNDVNSLMLSPLWLVATVTAVWLIASSVILAMVNRKKV